MYLRDAPVRVVMHDVWPIHLHNMMYDERFLLSLFFFLLSSDRHPRATSRIFPWSSVA